MITLNGPAHGLWNLRVNPVFFGWIIQINQIVFLEVAIFSSAVIVFCCFDVIFGSL